MNEIYTNSLTATTEPPPKKRNIPTKTNKQTNKQKTKQKPTKDKPNLNGKIKDPILQSNSHLLVNIIIIIIIMCHQHGYP